MVHEGKYSDRGRPHSGALRAALRAQTNDVHQQLHKHGAFVALFDGEIALPDYAALMQRFHGYYDALDHAIASAMDETLGGFAYANRGDLLALDLADLGFDTAEIAENPRCETLFDIVTPASLAGVLYVIEGATLGAAQIDRAAQTLLSAEHTKGRGFWAWSRAEGKNRWSMMRQLLSHLDAKHAAHAPQIQGANATFQALADWLSPLDQTVVQRKGAFS